MEPNEVRTWMGPRGEKTHFSMSEAAGLFDLTVQAIHHWLKTGRIRRHERTSRRGNYLIPREEIARLLAEEGREVPGLWERHRPKVLIVDDDPGIRRFALAAARSPKVPLSIRTAPSIEEGLLRAAEFRPDVILLDTSHPKDRMRADQGLAFIRGTKLLRKAWVVAMVHHSKIGEGMIRAGANAVLLKPFGLSEFRDAIQGKRMFGQVAKRSRQGSTLGGAKERACGPVPELDRLLNEVYLLILTRRPTPVALAPAVGVSMTGLSRTLRSLSKVLKARGFRLGAVGQGSGRHLQIEALEGPRGQAVGVGPETLRVRDLPADRPGLKVDDEIIYARDW